MRPRPPLIASALLIVLALGCQQEPPYNTLVEIPPGGDPPIKRPVVARSGKPRAPKPSIMTTLRKIEVAGAKPIAR